MYLYFLHRMFIKTFLIMDKSLIINEIIKHYNFKSDSAFAKHIGVSAQVISNWKSRNTYDAELIYINCLEINPEWLLTGKGEMLKASKVEDVKVASTENQEPDYKILYEEAKYTIELQKKYIENLESQLKNLEG